MKDVTRILSAVERGDLAAAEKLLPLVYDELRKMDESLTSLPEPASLLLTAVAGIGMLAQRRPRRK